jgi:hypothetical protein
MERDVEPPVPPDPTTGAAGEPMEPAAPLVAGEGVTDEAVEAAEQEIHVPEDGTNEG